MADPESNDVLDDWLSEVSTAPTIEVLKNLDVVLTKVESTFQSENPEHVRARDLITSAMMERFDQFIGQPLDSDRMRAEVVAVMRDVSNRSGMTFDTESVSVKMNPDGTVDVDYRVFVPPVADVEYVFREGRSYVGAEPGLLPDDRTGIFLVRNPATLAEWTERIDTLSDEEWAEYTWAKRELRKANQRNASWEIKAAYDRKAEALANEIDPERESFTCSVCRVRVQLPSGVLADDFEPEDLVCWECD